MCRRGVLAAASTAAAPSTYASRLLAAFLDDFRSAVPPPLAPPPFVATPPPFACAPPWDPFARPTPFVVVAGVASSPNTSHMAGLTDESASRKDPADAFLGMTLLE